MISLYIKQKNQDGFALIEVALVIFLVAAIGAAGYVAYKHKSRPSDAQQYNVQYKRQADTAAKALSSLAGQIDSSTSSAARHGANYGCVVYVPSQVGILSPSKTVDCKYYYFDYHISSNARAEAETLQNSIKEAGWTYSGGELGMIPAAYEREVGKSTNLTLLLDYTSDPEHKFTPEDDVADDFYKGLASKYLNGNNTIYGFVVEEDYVNQACSSCVVSGEYSSN